MPHLIVIGFDEPSEAQELHRALAAASKDGLLTIKDSAVVVKDADGKVSVDNQVSSGMWAATGIGGALGLLLGSVFFPLAGLALGVAGGALVGGSMQLGVDNAFVKDVQEKLRPGTSALFLLTDNENATGVLGVLRQHQGTLLQTNLPEEIEANMRRALGNKPAA